MRPSPVTIPSEYLSDLPGLIDDEGVITHDEPLPVTTPDGASGDAQALCKARRKKAPPQNTTSRGSRKRALDTAANDHAMNTAMATYIEEWKSAGDTSDSYFNTWSAFHRAHWDGLRRPAYPVVPLTPIFVHVVGALLKIGGYRSTKNYLNAAKERHLDTGTPWSSLLDHAGRRFVNSTQRGIGPPRQSEPLNFTLLLMCVFGWAPLVAGGPVNTIAVLVLFTMFLLREVEGSLALRAHVTVNTGDETITWSLPSSKTDPQAHGCTRSWGCTCIDPSSPTRECPYHTMLEHLALLDAHFGDMSGTADFPLFPDSEGNVVQADKMVGLVDELAKRSGEDIHTQEGQRRYGKHSFRSTGAVYLSSIGIELLKIQMLARWASTIITHYTRLAPLRSITADFKRAVLKNEACKAITDKPAPISSTTSKPDKMRPQKAKKGVDMKKVNQI